MSRRLATLTLATLNPCVKELQYAVRGPIVTRAAELEKQLKKGEDLPFEEVIMSNLGDPQAMGQKPVTFIREVLSLTAYPELIKSAPENFTKDAIQRARELLACTEGYSAGSYTDSVGISLVLDHIAEFITQRDGYPAYPGDIFLGTGAGGCIRNVMQLSLTADPVNKPGFMLPTPQYPLFSAIISEFHGQPINYYLDEANDWKLDITELDRALNEAKVNCSPKAIIVISPGNPTAQILSEETIAEVIKFAAKNNLIIIVDEVFQFNIMEDGKKFISFKKVLRSLGPDYDHVELASFHSSAKGVVAECGFRGGYCELTNFLPEIKAMLIKLISSSLCSPTQGQIAVSCMVKPPTSDAADLYNYEIHALLDSLKERAMMVHEKLNNIPGIQCNPLRAALYAFPKIEIPRRAIEEAESQGVEPDFFYCLSLLEKAGLCVVPGSGFGQIPGTYHFRMTLLPPKHQLIVFMDKLAEFHVQFTQKWS